MTRRPIFVILALAWLAGSARGDEAPVVMVRGQLGCPPGQSCPTVTAWSYGSGVVIGRDAKSRKLLALTAGHVVYGTKPSTIAFKLNGRWVHGRHLDGARNQYWDIALFELDTTESHSAYELRYAPQRGAQVLIEGFPSDDRMDVRRASLVNVSDTQWLLWDGAKPHSGESGGAVVDRDGVLLGIITHAVDDGSQQGRGMNAVCLRRFCANVLGYVPGDVDVIVTQQPQAQAQPAPSTIPNPAIGPKPSDSIPHPSTGPQSALQPAPDLTPLKTQIAALEAEIKALQNRPIVVELKDRSTGEIKRREFAPGEPIRLMLPESDSNSAPPTQP